MAKWKSPSKKRRKSQSSQGPAVKVIHADDLAAHFGQREAKLVEVERQVASEYLASDHPLRAIHAVGNALSWADDFGKQRLTMASSGPPLACKSGCHWCCFLKVEVSPPEALIIAKYLQTMVTDEGVEVMKAQTAKVAADRRVFSNLEKAEARIPCALLLQDGTCGAYEVRPLACRGWNSTDSDACRRGLDDDTVTAMTAADVVGACTAIGIGFLAALKGAGLSSELLELNTALDVALREPNAMERWLAGEPIFARAASDGGGFRD